MIRVRQGELTDTGPEAVVRPVRSDGDAVSAAGRRLEAAAGVQVAARLQTLGELPIGGAVVTPGGDLPVLLVIHAVVQSADEAVSRTVVQRALVNALRRAQEWGVRSLALAPIGTGAGNLEAEEAAGILVEVLQEHLRNAVEPMELEVVVETAYEAAVYEHAISALAGSP